MHWFFCRMHYLLDIPLNLCWTVVIRWFLHQRKISFAYSHIAHTQLMLSVGWYSLLLPIFYILVLLTVFLTTGSLLPLGNLLAFSVSYISWRAIKIWAEVQPGMTKQKNITIIQRKYQCAMWFRWQDIISHLIRLKCLI